MATNSLITITGIEEVRKLLKDAPKSVVARGYVKALAAGAGVFFVDLQQRTRVRDAAVGVPQRTGEKGKRKTDRHPGDLLRALTTDIALDSQFRGGSAAVGYAGFQGHIANWLEFGHVIARSGGWRIDKSGRKRKTTAVGQVKPYPAMRPCFDANADEAIAAFANSLEQTLKEGVLP